MKNSKVVLLNRELLKQHIVEQSIKHIWLANEIGVSEKTLSRWVNGDVGKIRISNLVKLAGALRCPKEDLIAVSEIEVYSSDKNRAELISELNSDSFLYELMMSSKIKLAISLIKSTFHSALPSAIVANFYTKLGYASLIHREYSKAAGYFKKGLEKAESISDDVLVFSANLGLAITLFFDNNFHDANHYLKICGSTIEFSDQEKAHFHSTYSLYYLYIGDFSSAIKSANTCLNECMPVKPSIEKNLFKCTALQVLAACYLFKGDEDRAYEYCMESLDVAKHSGYKRSVAVSKGYLSAIYCVKKDYTLAEQLIEQSIQLVSVEDIALPSLLCIALFVSSQIEDDAKCDVYLARVSSICKPNTIMCVFATYQMYLNDIKRGDALAAAGKLLRVQDALIKLKLPCWQAWINDRIES